MTRRRPQTGRPAVVIEASREPAAAFAITRRIAAALAGEPPPLIAITLKLSGELVDNALTFPSPRESLEIAVRTTTSAIRVELRDRHFTGAALADNARAQWFMDRLADRWGTTTPPDTVWFEVDRDRAP